MKAVHKSGARKTAVARATLQAGNGVVRINNKMLDFYEPALLRTKIQEPLILAGDSAKKVDLDVNVRGGGVSSQAEAIRLAIARCLIVYNKALQQEFLNYDRTLLVADVRVKEQHKPNCHGKARAKRQFSKR